MKNILTTFALILAFPATFFATHIVGGNFIIVQNSANSFSVTVKVYRDCCGTCTAMPTSLDVGIYDKVTNAYVQTVTLLNPILSNITLGDECYTPTGICVQEGIFTLNNVTLANNPNGYYFQTELYARNNIIDNITNPGGTGMSFYAEIPDPAIMGLNSTPDFGPYPSDGYFCINNTKYLDFSVTDPDGDQLVYSLVNPLDGNLGGNGTSAAPYPSVVWQPPYNLANIVGGTPAMNINTTTGIVEATPALAGTYVFAVRIEEYRNSIKIGEVRRDVQYHALNCIVDDLPEIMLPDSLYIEVYSQGCFDIVVLDADATDTVSILVTSSAIVEGAIVGLPAPYTTSPDTTYQFHYIDETTSQPDSVVLDAPWIQNGAYFGIGGVGLQFCWQTSCEDLVNSPYILDVAAFSLGCSGDTNFINQQVELVVGPQLPTNETIYMPDSVFIEAQQGACHDIVVLSSDQTDTVSILISTNTITSGAELSLPAPYITTPVPMYYFYYYNTSTFQNDSVLLEAPNYSNGGYWGVGGVALHYCFPTDCEDISEVYYDIEVNAYEVGCFGDTTFKPSNTVILVYPPTGTKETVPNVFSPNGDGLNDVFTLDGVINQCYDTIHVEIYNRWGQMVYESDDVDFRWDGKNKRGNELPEGTYYVLLTGIFGDSDVTSQYPLTLFRKD